MAAADCPPSLKAVKPYLERGQELEAKEPLVSYHCRLFALNEAMAMRASLPKADMGFVIGLMDLLEKQKATVGELDDAAATVENFGQELFQKADDADRAGRSDLKTGKAFLVAAQVLETCKQFGDLPPDLSEKIKYAKWRFVEMAKAVKEGRPPAPPRGTDPPKEEEEDDVLSVPPAAPEAPPVDAGASTAPPPYGYASTLPPQPPAEAAGLPHYMGLPQAPAMPAAPPAMPAIPMPSAPATPAYWGHNGPPPPPPPHGMPAPPAARQPTNTFVVQVLPGFKPARSEIYEAAQLCKASLNSLQFQDSETAVHNLMQALQLLTQPPPPEAPEAPQ